MNPGLQIHIFPTALEGLFIGNYGKQSQLDMVEESSVPEVSILQCVHGNSRPTLETLYLIIGSL